MSMPVTDRELLELAAKAYGIGPIIGRDDSFGLAIGPLARLRYWNPLTNDGEALRLAVKLDLTIFRPGSCPGALVKTEDAHTTYSDACVRRAIVLAAAAIGRDLP